jgi:hypothetical protein
MGFPEYTAALELLLGPRLVGEFVFPYPARRTDRAGVNAWMTAEARAAATPRHRLAALVAPSDDPGVAGEWLRGGACRGLKPYHSVCQTTVTPGRPTSRTGRRSGCGVAVTNTRRCSSFTWSRTPPPPTRPTRRPCSASAPGIRVVASCSRTSGGASITAPPGGLKALASRSNIVVDTSAITESEGIKIAFDVLGVDRVLYGSDYPISHVSRALRHRRRFVSSGSMARR